MGFIKRLGYSLDYAEDLLGDVQHDYQLYYIMGKKDFKSKRYQYYQDAFDAAVEFAEKLVKSKAISKEIKLKVLDSLHVIDCEEMRDVTPSDFKKIMLDKIEELKWSYQSV